MKHISPKMKKIMIQEAVSSTTPCQIASPTSGDTGAPWDVISNPASVASRNASLESLRISAASSTAIGTTATDVKLQFNAAKYPTSRPLYFGSMSDIVRIPIKCAIAIKPKPTMRGPIKSVLSTSVP